MSCGSFSLLLHNFMGMSKDCPQKKKFYFQFNDVIGVVIITLDLITFLLVLAFFQKITFTITSRTILETGFSINQNVSLYTVYLASSRHKRNTKSIAKHVHTYSAGSSKLKSNLNQQPTTKRLRHFYYYLKRKPVNVLCAL